MKKEGSRTKMRLISNCSELRTGSRPISDIVSNNPIDSKDKIIAYLKAGKDDGVICSGVYDYISDFPTGDTIHCYKDDQYKWNNSEIYHFENYNMELDSDFIKMVISKG